MSELISSGSDGTHDEMLKLTIRCHPAVPIESSDLERWLREEVAQLRVGAPRAVIRLSRLTQEFPSSESGIGWLLELEMPKESPLRSRGRLASILADLRLLGLQPTALSPVATARELVSPNGGGTK